jgi:hypothetical protein
MLKVSTSTDGNRVAPWCAMPVVVMTSSAILVPCPLLSWRDNGVGTRWFHGGDRRARRRRKSAKSFIFGQFSAQFTLTPDL